MRVRALASMLRRFQLSRLLFRKEWLLLFGAVALALAAGVFAYLSRPAMLSVAVAPRGGVEAQLVEAYARALEQERTDIRVRPLAYDDLRQSAEALQHRQADLAVIRPDVSLPENGLTVAILREEAVILIAPASNRIEDVADLAKRRLGIVARHEADPQLIATVLSHYELARPEVSFVPLDLAQVHSALSEKKVDAVAIVAGPTSAAATEFVRAAERASDRKIRTIPIAEAEALALRHPTLTTIELKAGTLGGRPKQPDEDVNTVGVSYRLMARSDLDRSVVSEVAQYLFQMRSRLAQATAASNLMKAPDTDTSTSATLPNHPGAVDYFNREQLTFMDRYGDWIWLALFSTGGISSAMAWIAQRLVRRRRELVDEVLDRLICILSEARAATSAAELDERAIEIDRLVTHAVRFARNRTTSTRTMGALIMAIDSARAAIADRRRDILDDEKRQVGAAPGEGAPRASHALASPGPST